MANKLPNPTLSWLQNGEPVSGGIRGNNSGSGNRMPVQLLQNDFYLINRLNLFSTDSGFDISLILPSLTPTLGITDANVQSNANIEESKLNLALRTRESIGGSLYYDTGELADDVLSIYDTTTTNSSLISSLTLEVHNICAELNNAVYNLREEILDDILDLNLPVKFNDMYVKITEEQDNLRNTLDFTLTSILTIADYNIQINSENIANNTLSISVHSDDISILQSKVNINTQNIFFNTENINIINSEITSINQTIIENNNILTGNFLDLSSQVHTNTNNIAIALSQIQINTDDITLLQVNIHNNSININTLTEKINTLLPNNNIDNIINTLTENIYDLTEKINNLLSNNTIVNIVNNINSNSNDILLLQVQTDINLNELSVLQNQVGDNTLNISTLTANISNMATSTRISQMNDELNAFGITLNNLATTVANDTTVVNNISNTISSSINTLNSNVSNITSNVSNITSDVSNITSNVFNITSNDGLINTSRNNSLEESDADSFMFFCF